MTAAVALSHPPSPLRGFGAPGRRTSHRRTLPRRANEIGMSLVEATIIVMVLATLTAVIAPSVGDYVEDARNTAAKEDTEAIGTAVLNLLRDTGSRCLRVAGTTECTVTNRVDLFVSGGNNPDSVTATDITLPDADAATTVDGAMNWLPDANAPTQTDTIDAQLILNNMGTPYAAASFTGGGGPRMKLGWRGAYLNGPISSDPWGFKYQVNTVFLTVASNAIDGAVTPDNTQEGLREAGWQRDVLVLSPGANGAVQTSFGGTATGGVSSVGDDVVYVIGGGTR